MDGDGWDDDLDYYNVVQDDGTVTNVWRDEQ